MATCDYAGSNLLGALNTSDLTLIMPHLQSLVLSEGAILYEPGDDVQYTYFPRGAAVAAFVVHMEDGEAVETAMIGREGAVGGIVSSGHLPAFARSCVMHGGEFFRLPTVIIEQIKQSSPHLSNLFARYADCLLAQIFQSVACNARHSITQRAAKWLISAGERTGQHEIILTQGQLGSLLGVGRSYVTRVIAGMKASGVVATRRGGLRILDIERLQGVSCTCNQLVASHFASVLAGVYPEATPEPAAQAKALA